MKITFYIVDNQNFEPLEGIHVFSSDKTINGISDENGYVVIDNWQLNQFTTLTMTGVGLKDKKLVAADLNNKTIVMEEDILEGTGVEVVGIKPKKKFCWLCWLVIGGTTIFAATRKDDKEQ